MTTTIVAIALFLTPILGVMGCLLLADRRERRRSEQYARQISLTDAIHRELGAVVAPTVQRRRGGRWLIAMTVPLHRPNTVATILRITGEEFAPQTRSARESYQIVLTGRPARQVPTGTSTYDTALERQARLAA